MPYRRFVDSSGNAWRVWDVVPTPLDRRLAMRRIRTLRIAHPERRIFPDRRVDMGRSRLFFPPTEKGWLCFESEGARRRLSPTPDDWAAREDAELERLCLRAAELASRRPERT